MICHISAKKISVCKNLPILDTLLRGTVTPSSIRYPPDHGAKFAVDGKPSVNHNYLYESDTEPYPWFQMEFAERKMVTRVTFTNRPDIWFHLFDNFDIHVGDEPAVIEQKSTNPICASFSGSSSAGQVHDFHCNNLHSGKYLLVQKNAAPVMSFSEIVVYGIPAGIPINWPNLTS